MFPRQDLQGLCRVQANMLLLAYGLTLLLSPRRRVVGRNDFADFLNQFKLHGKRE